MTERELVVLEAKIKKEILNASWRENHLTWMGKTQKKVAQQFGATEKQEKMIQELLKYNKENYPHHILGGDTWNEFVNGFLMKNSKARENIKKFYEKEYKMYLENTENLESNYPIWIIGTHPGLNTGDVQTMIINYIDNKKLIILFINKGGAF